jgi:gliding motility-associated-like protein
MHGDQGPISSLGNFGVKGVPAATNKPPGLYEAVYWTDLNGDFWIFGGVAATGMYSDMWKFNVATNQWTWMKGPGILDQPGTYGTMGVPNASNNPGARGWGACSWTDNANNLWLFGGFGCDALGVQGDIADLWKYDITTNEWTWMKGDNLSATMGSYGTQGVSSPTNYPAGRDETNTSWKDLNGKLWLFGGLRSSSPGGEFDDLWRYDPLTNEFTWMKGSSTTGSPAVYGTLGVGSPANTPGARYSYTRSVDLNGDLWLFGGCAMMGGCGFDIWKYSMSTNNWAWMDGPNFMGQDGNHGILCDSSQSNQPDPRSENRACWADPCGNFINFGGTGDYNDLWFYDINNLRWHWIGGSDLPGATGNYGILGVTAASNEVPARFGSCGFADKDGNFWLFGGYGNFNDMWKFTITDSACIPGNCFTTVPPTPPGPQPPVVNAELFIPNVFSPNADPHNNVFEIRANGFKSYQLEIYNRWGERVFQSDNSTVHWNGRINNTGKEVPDGTYYYLLKLTDTQGKATEHNGFVSLVR